ncbi:tetratricopeptide repeat protein [Urechidicola croceus]|uniref:Uncharacterized protein n=1 Tax=Urechidicola croceus TaxID=1850246 RepID=A0A1D8P7C7_9FLAO|nr:hypothetical protein [Urechidicola croceus]AOW20469.1 hypothetical protein LPB138_07185 [Urechidicola croceus]
MGSYINNYVFKAIESFDYDLESTMEALNYALSYDDKDTMALTLLGRVYAEKLYKYNEAIGYYKEALAININAFEVYEHYINVLLWNEDYEEVSTFIDFALTVKGSDKAILYLKKAVLKEQIKEYKIALTFIKLAKEYAYNSGFINTINEEKERIKGKMPKKKKYEKSKKSNKK